MKLHERIVAFDLVGLAAGDIERQRVAFGVGAEVDFGREAAARATERFLILIPPFTPAACWCARTIVELIACSSSAGGPGTRQSFERCIPHAELAPAGEPNEDRVPIAVSLGHVAPRRAGAQHPENAIDRSPLVQNRWTALAAVR